MIEAKSLTRRYGADTLALDDVSFRVGRGEIYCLLGAPGAGKTTAVNLFLGVSAPTHGQAIIGGIDCAAEPLAARRHAAFITPAMGLHSALSARRNVEFFARMAGASVMQASVENAMRGVGIAERHFDRAVRDLSRQTHVLLWLSIAALRRVPALVLDEPTAGLDAHAAAEIHECLLDFCREGVAVLVVTSEVILATQIADRIGLLTSGRLAAERTRQELLGQNLTQFYFEYAGDHAGPTAAAPSARLTRP